MQDLYTTAEAVSAMEDVDMRGSSCGDGGHESSGRSASFVRKPTYILRKEEKQRLLKEIERLQRQLSALQDVADDGLQQQQVQTSMLKSIVQHQQLSLVNAQSAISAFVGKQGALPYDSAIHLGRDFSQRREVLIAAKQRVLEGAISYSTARSRFLDPFQPFSEKTYFLLDSGDYCSLQLDQTPLMLPNSSVREVFDTIITNHSSIDMRITDAFGDITTCDEMFYDIDGVCQFLLTSQIACGVDVEMNIVNFYQFFDRAGKEYGGGPVGVLTAAFVDKDELYPYRSSERVRYDITGVVVIHEQRRKRHNPVTHHEEEESVIVATQSCLFNIRRPEMQLPPSVEQRLRDQIGQWGKVMISAVLDQAYARYGCKPPLL